MSIIGWAVTALIPGAGIAGAVAKFGAKLVFGKIGAGLKSGGGFIRDNWKPLVIIAAVASVAIYILILRGEVRHRDKLLTADAALIADVKKEVDRGVGKPTAAADAPTYIRSFVDNLATVKAALDRQSAALRLAQQQADARTAAAHQAAQPTVAQGDREKVRQRIVDPARTTGLTADEWGKL